MPDLATNERRLLAALKKDGRASITTLSGLLGLSRATVQAKLERLTRTGIIRRFTIETDPSAELDLIRAVMLIEVEGPQTRSVVAALKRIREISSLHTTNGTWDLVAQVEATSLSEFDRVLREVREISVC